MKQIQTVKAHACQIFIEKLPLTWCSAIALQHSFTADWYERKIKNSVVKYSSSTF